MNRFAAGALAGCLTPFFMGVALAQPVISFAGNAASIEERFAPGMAVLVFGQNLTSNMCSESATTVDQKKLCDAQLLVNGSPLGLSFATSSQITGIFPADLKLGPSVLVAKVGDTLSQPYALVVDAHAPGMFVATVNGSIVGIFQNSNGVVSLEQPAIPGDLLSGFGTGFGLPNLLPALVVPGGGGGPTQNAAEVSVTLGCETTGVLFAGPSPSIPGLDQITFSVPANVPGGPQDFFLEINGARSNTVTLPVAGSGDVPFIRAGVNGASFAPCAPAAAGSILSLFVAGDIGDEITTGIFPETEAGGLSVTFDGVSAPLFDVVGAPSNQINVLVPTELPEMGKVEVILASKAGESATFLLEMTPAAPGIFRIGGTSFAAATLHDTRWLPIPDAISEGLGVPTDCLGNEISPVAYCGRPIRPGEVLDLYLTGLGRATSDGNPGADPLPTGSVAPADANPLYHTLLTPEVTIGGLPAEVIFSGLTPAYAGLYQINLFVPGGVEAGDEVEVTITMPNGATDTVTIAVQG